MVTKVIDGIESEFSLNSVGTLSSFQHADNDNDDDTTTTSLPHLMS